MSDLRERMLLAASEIESDWPSAATLRSRGARRRTRRRVVAAATVGASAVVVVGFAAVVQHPQAQPPATPTAPCPVTLTAPASVPRSDVPVVDVTRGRLAFVDASGAWVASPGEKPVHVASSTAQTTTDGHPGFPPSPQLAWSNDGTELAMTTQANGGDNLAECGDVALVQADGSGVRLLSHNAVGSTAFEPSFSPDGRSVAYLVDRVAPYTGADPSAQPGTIVAHWSVVVAQLDGGDREVPLDCWPGESLTWSPDGRQLALGCNTGIAVVSSQEDTVTLVRLPEGRMSAAIGWREDGTLLAALPVEGEPQDDLVISGYDLAGQKWSQISHPALDVEWGIPFPAGGFSPDGRELLATGSQIGGTAENYEEHFYSIDVESGSVAVNSILNDHPEWTVVEWASAEDLLVAETVARGWRVATVRWSGGSQRSVATAPATPEGDSVLGTFAWHDG